MYCDFVIVGLLIDHGCPIVKLNMTIPIVFKYTDSGYFYL